MKPHVRAVLDGIDRGRPVCGPSTVHIDITNACNAACVTCWDHSALLDEGRSAQWKRRRLPLADFLRLCRQLSDMGSVRSLILSGMGDPMTHPDVYDMIAAARASGWHTTVLTNLLAADIDRLAQSGVDQLLVGVHGASPASYAAFHPGWSEMHFARLCQHLRVLARAGIRCRHVQVICRDNADELVEMVRFGHRFGADRVNFKLASLGAGTEACGIDTDQRDWLAGKGITRARAIAAELGVHTNLELFERQVAASSGDGRATTPIEEVGCFMGYVYARITVDQEVLFCCNTEIPVGSAREQDFVSLWHGEAWQALRLAVRSGRYFPGCDRCGKFEQNVSWSDRYRRSAGRAAWEIAVGRGRGRPEAVPDCATQRVVD